MFVHQCTRCGKTTTEVRAVDNPAGTRIELCSTTTATPACVGQLATFFTGAPVAATARVLAAQAAQAQAALAAQATQTAEHTTPAAAPA